MTNPRAQPVTAAADTPLGTEPTTNGRFLLEVDGKEIGIFLQVSGLEVTVQTVTVEEGGQNQFAHQLPGRMSWPNLTFTRGITESNALFEWFTESSGHNFAANGGKLVRRTGAVTLLDHLDNRLRAWNFVDVFPVRWKGPSLQTDSNDQLVEELELAHHGFTVAPPAAAPAS